MKRLRQTGGESVQARAERLAEVALASWNPHGDGKRLLIADELRAFFIAGFMACAQDEVRR